MTVVRYAALGLLICVLSLLLREAGFRGSRLVSILGVVALVGAALTSMEGVMELLSLSERIEGGADQLAAILKIVGAGIIFGMVTDMARDMGEPGVASALSVVGRVEIFALSVPYIMQLLDLAAGYFNQ